MKVMKSTNASSHFILTDHKHHQAQRLSAATQERLCERWKVSLTLIHHNQQQWRSEPFKAAWEAGEGRMTLILTKFRRGQESGLI